VQLKGAFQRSLTVLVYYRTLMGVVESWSFRVFQTLVEHIFSLWSSLRPSFTQQSQAALLV